MSKLELYSEGSGALRLSLISYSHVTPQGEIERGNICGQTYFTARMTWVLAVLSENFLNLPSFVQ